MLAALLGLGAPALAQAQTSPAGDVARDDGSGWYRHGLGDDFHCLLDDRFGQGKPGTAAVLYRPAPLPA